MSVKIEAPALSMPESLDSLRVTPLPMHKLYFELSSVDQWYAIMRDARAQFGKNWRSQPRVKRRLGAHKFSGVPVKERVWFEVPDSKFSTWVAIKHAVRPLEGPNK